MKNILLVLLILISNNKLKNVEPNTIVCTQHIVDVNSESGVRHGVE